MSEHKPEITVPIDSVRTHVSSVINQETLALAERLSLDHPDYHVVSYSMTIIVAGRAWKFDRTGDILTEDIRVMIGNLARGKILYFESIFAKSALGEEIVIPWCIIRVG